MQFSGTESTEVTLLDAKVLPMSSFKHRKGTCTAIYVDVPLRTYTHSEIDLISTSKRDDVMTGWFAECKYRNEPVGTDVLQTLIHKTSLVKGYDKCRYVLYSKSGFTAELQDRDVELFDLDSVLDFKGM